MLRVMKMSNKSLLLPKILSTRHRQNHYLTNLGESLSDPIKVKEISADIIIVSTFLSKSPNEKKKKRVILEKVLLKDTIPLRKYWVQFSPKKTYNTKYDSIYFLFGANFKIFSSTNCF